MRAVRVAPGLLPPLTLARRKTRGSGRTAWGVLVPSVIRQLRAPQRALSRIRHRSPRPGLPAGTGAEKRGHRPGRRGQTPVPGSSARLSGPGRAGALRGLRVCQGSRISGRLRVGMRGGRGGAGGAPRAGGSAPRGVGLAALVQGTAGGSW